MSSAGLVSSVTGNGIVPAAAPTTPSAVGDGPTTGASCSPPRPFSASACNKALANSVADPGADPGAVGWPPSAVQCAVGVPAVPVPVIPGSRAVDGADMHGSSMLPAVPAGSVGSRANCGPVARSPASGLFHGFPHGLRQGLLTGFRAPDHVRAVIGGALPAGLARQLPPRQALKFPRRSREGVNSFEFGVGTLPAFRLHGLVHERLSRASTPQAATRCLHDLSTSSAASSTRSQGS